MDTDQWVALSKGRDSNSSITRGCPRRMEKIKHIKSGDVFSSGMRRIDWCVGRTQRLFVRWCGAMRLKERLLAVRGNHSAKTANRRVSPC